MAGETITCARVLHAFTCISRQLPAFTCNYMHYMQNWWTRAFEVIVCNAYVTHLIRCNLKLNWPASSKVQVWTPPKFNLIKYEISKFKYEISKFKFEILALPGSEWNLQVHWRLWSPRPRLGAWWPARVTSQDSRVSDKHVLRRARRDFEPRTQGGYNHRQVSNYLLLFKFVAGRKLHSCLDSRSLAAGTGLASAA